MAYRPPSHPPLTEWARFIDRVKRERGWSATKAFEEAGPRLGYGPKSRSGYLAFERDREPTAAQAAILAEVFGGWPDARDRADSAPATNPSELVAALREQTAAIKELVTELQRLAVGQMDLAQNVAVVVGRLEGLGGLPADPSATPGQGTADGPRPAHPTSAGSK